jgi:hypothetical protein
LGSESDHANSVGYLFYGGQSGAAPGVAHVENFEASFFYNTLVRNQSAIAAAVVNQSFIFGSQVASIDRDYDDYAARFNTLFVSGVGNSGTVSSPATAYNGIAASAFGGASSIGPTSDGRCKPDLCAPGSFTSFATPLISGVAAMLLQAAARGDAGPGAVSAATNALTLKALLLNGAFKPVDWTNGATTPLDARYGAGIVNILNSYRALRGGKHSVTVSTSHPRGGAHWPPVTAENIPARRGWDLGNASSNVPQDGVNHYFFEIAGGAPQALTFLATLVWTRHQNKATINDLDLFLYDAANSNLVASSESPVDNVEHLFVGNLPPGRYDLQVLKHGGVTVSSSETYALAFDFGPPQRPLLTNTVASGGQFQFRLLGEPNQTYVIERSADLSAWTRFSTNTTSAGGFSDVLDPFVPGLQRRFYRAVLFP